MSKIAKITCILLCILFIQCIFFFVLNKKRIKYFTNQNKNPYNLLRNCSKMSKIVFWMCIKKLIICIRVRICDFGYRKGPAVLPVLNHFYIISSSINHSAIYHLLAHQYCTYLLVFRKLFKDYFLRLVLG